MHLKKRVRDSLAFMLALLAADAAEATTFTYNIMGGVPGVLRPANGRGDVDYIRTNITRGVLTYDDVRDIITAELNFSGNILENSNGGDIGDISGQILYQWDNILAVNLRNSSATRADDQFLLAITDANNNNRPVDDGQGDGVGALTLTLNGTQSFVTDLNGKHARFTAAGIASGAHAAYQPVASYLVNQRENPYLMFGHLNGWRGQLSLHTWFMSAPFTLNLPGYRGEYIFTTDIHAKATRGGSTEIPEPASFALLSAGILGLRLRRRKRA